MSTLIKKYYFFIFIILFTVKNANAQWYSQSYNTISKLTDVYFINENTGWICGDDMVLKTINSGTNWQKTTLTGINNSIRFLNAQTGFIASNNGKLYKTMNGGANWELIDLGITTNLNKIKFLNNNFGVVVGNKTKVFKTTDGGLNWSNVSIGSDILDILDIEILSENKFNASGLQSTIWYTENAGESWHEHSMGMPNPLFAIDFVNENTGMVSGCCGMLMRTTNAGENWSQEVYLTPGFSVHSLKYLTPSKIMIAADAGYIFRTSNNGMNWDSLAAPNGNDLYGMHFVNENTGWLVGIWGTIYKTTNGGGQGFPIGINQISTEIPGKFSLSQNYPNPFNPVTKIVFDVTSNVNGQLSNMKLSIYDITGKFITELVNSELNEGTYEVIWNAQNNPSGVYFYTLRSENFSETKRMVLLK